MLETYSKFAKDEAVEVYTTFDLFTFQDALSVIEYRCIFTCFFCSLLDNLHVRAVITLWTVKL